MRHKLAIFIFVGIILSFFASGLSFAQDKTQGSTLKPNEYSRGKIVKIRERQTFENALKQEREQLFDIKLLDGNEKDKTVESGSTIQNTSKNPLKVGDEVVVAKTYTPKGASYLISDRYRMPSVFIIIALFFATILFFGKLKGLTSLFGLILTIFVILLYIVPAIIAGQNPLFIGISGSFSIAIASIYLSHGFSKRTTVAVISTLIALGLSCILSVVFVYLAKLTGSASEEVMFLQNGPLANIDFHGLLLAGIIIGALGVLDDITTAQSAAVEQISSADPKLTTAGLYYRGLSIGKEHIASLVNTLVLAYVGASFPLILLFSTTHNLPFWVAANTEIIVEEIVRALVGSIGLVFAVPITTILSAYYLKVKEGKK